MNILFKYKPRTVSDLWGQPRAVGQLSGWLAAVEAEPSSQAFLFDGPAGVGKTTAAWALARDLGCAVEDGDFGGVCELPSGKQDGGAVERLLESMRCRPLAGSGWRVAIVNEADYMTRQAEVIWLDALENLPPMTAVVFTTNDMTRLSARLVSRCEVVRFAGAKSEVEEALAALVRHVWERETGRPLHRIPENLGLLDWFSGTLSFRLALQQIAPYLRTLEDLPESFAVPTVRAEEASGATSQTYSSAARKAAQTRKRNAAGRG